MRLVCKRIFMGFVLTFCLPLLFMVDSLFAIDDTFGMAYIDFDFSPPGARAMGMGGAFVALSDDATSGVTNPAGLAQLQGQEVSVEISFDDADDRGKDLDFSDTNIAFNLKYESVRDDTFNLSFASFTLPIMENRFHLSLFYHKISDLEISTEQDWWLRDDPAFTLRQVGKTELSLDEYGVSLARGFFNKKLLIGVGISSVHFDLESRFGFDNDDEEDRLWGDDASSGASHKLAYRVGVIYIPFERLRIGASASFMPEFSYDTVYRYPGERVENWDNHFQIPDTFSIGAAFNITQDWIVLTEVRRIEYGDLMDDFNQVYFPDASFDLDDETEFHIGTEYVLHVIGNELISAFRLGAYHEPGHSLEGDDHPIVDRLFSQDEDSWHYTFGIGMVVKNRLQFDLAGDVDDENNEGVKLSLVYRF